MAYVILDLITITFLKRKLQLCSSSIWNFFCKQYLFKWAEANDRLFLQMKLFLSHNMVCS